MEVIYNVFSEERYHHFRHVLSVSRASLQDQRLRCKTAVKSRAGWETGCGPRAVVEGCCYQVLQCVIQAFRWKRSGFLLKKSVIPMDVN